MRTPSVAISTRISLGTDIPQSPTTPGCPSKPGMSHQAQTIKLLHTQPDEKEQTARLRVLGYGLQLSKSGKRQATKFHEKIAVKFNNRTTETPDNDEKVLEMLMPEESDLEHLFAQGTESETVLHVLLSQETYQQKEPELTFHFPRIKPLLRFLLKICPGLPADPDYLGATPLYGVINSTMKDQTTAEEEMVSRRGTVTKAESARPQHLARADIEDIISYICGDKAREDLGSAKAIESLTMITLNHESHSLEGHALHKAIEHEIGIDEEIVKKLENIGRNSTDGKGTGSESCLEALDANGKTCLHLALTRPFTTVKEMWARNLVRIKPDLLQSKMTSKSQEFNNLTPLQFFIEERKADEQQMSTALKSRSKENLEQGTPKRDKQPDRKKVDLKGLEDWLKLYCLREFDNATARSIMFKRDQSQCMFHSIEFTVIAEQQ